MSFVIALLALIATLLTGAGEPSARRTASGDLALWPDELRWDRAIP